MLERKSGSIINMASIGGVVAVRERLAYTTTKFAVVGALNILANVAGIGHVGTLLQTASADLDKLYAVNAV